MKDLHPQGLRVLPSVEEPSSPSMKFSGSAPGPSGRRAEHLKAAVKSAFPNRTDKALEAVPRLVNVLAAGGLPEEAAPYFAGARLNVGSKKSGGIRPIAVGNILCRLKPKCSSNGMAASVARSDSCPGLESGRAAEIPAAARLNSVAPKVETQKQQAH